MKAWPFVVGGIAFLGLVGAAAAVSLRKQEAGGTGEINVDDLIHPENPLIPIDMPPQLIPLPKGWRYSRTKAEVPKDAVAAASGFLRSSKLGEFADHTFWGLLKEYHKDDHVSPGVVKWHPGVTVLVPDTVTV